MFTPDWTQNHENFGEVVVALDLDPHKIADITPERVAAGVWIINETDTLFVKGERSSIRVLCWNQPDVRLEIAKLLLQPVWRL